MAQKKTTLEATSDSVNVVTRGKGKVKLYKTARKKTGGEFFELRWKVGRKTLRRAFSQFEAAIDAAKQIVKALDASMEETTLLDPETAATYARIEKKLGGIPLEVAVDYYIRTQGGVSNVSVPDAFAEYWKDCTQKGVGKRHLETIKNHVKNFCDNFAGNKLREITADDIEEYLLSHNWCALTVANNLRSIQRFFTFCKKKHLPSHRETAADLLDPPKVKSKTPEVFTPDELAAIFAAAKREDYAYIAIAAFGGGRRAEIERLSFSDIDLENGVIALSSEITKTNRRRTLDIPPALKDWLELGWGEGAIVKNGDPLKNIRVSFPKKFWKQNGLRHSFASYHLAKHRNAGLTAELAGHSTQTLQGHYKALVTKQAADEWFSITPAKVTSLYDANKQNNIGSTTDNTR